MEVDALKELHKDDLIAKQGVVGVGVGNKWAGGVPTDQPAIIVFVEKKRTKRGVAQKFSAADIVPDYIGGVPTDIIEVGHLVKHGGGFQQRIRPIKPGYSCGHKDITAGTIGGLFIDRDGDPVILSNNHVLANENKAKIGDPIYQPGPNDAIGNLDFRGWTDPTGSLPYIGTLKKFVPIRSETTQDSAIAVLHDKVIKSSLVDSLYPIINRPLTGIGQPTMGMQVQKCGRTTGYTTGRIMAMNASFTIDYDIGPVKFNDCVVLSAMSKGGDSGSVITDMNMRAICHLFAGSNKVTLANPISYAVQEYGLKLWNPIGATGVDTLDFGDGTWRQVAGNGTINKTDKLVTITAPANQSCFLESEIKDFQTLTVTVNTGSDKGTTWGPGLTVQWPTGSMKVNVRNGDRFGGYFNGTYNIKLGQVKPNTDYGLRIRKSTVGTYVGEVRDGNRWYTVIELPVSIFPHSPVSVRVGKTDLIGQATHQNDGGQAGVCVFKDFVQD